MQRELSAKLTEGLYFFEFFPFYNPSASHLLGTSLYTREAWVTLRTKLYYAGYSASNSMLLCPSLAVGTADRVCLSVHTDRAWMSALPTTADKFSTVFYFY